MTIQKPNNYKIEVKCFNCEAKGQGENKNSVKKCFSCNNYGHIGKSCPVKIYENTTYICQVACEHLICQ